MSDVEQPEIVHPGGAAEAPASEPEAVESVSSPAKVMRIGAMVKQLLDEVRAASLDEAGRERLKAIYDTSVAQLSESLSPDLQAELARLNPPFSGPTPSEAELRVAQAQLVGWLEGLFHGIQAALYAQQVQAQSQFQNMRLALPSSNDDKGDDSTNSGENPAHGGMYL